MAEIKITHTKKITIPSATTFGFDDKHYNGVFKGSQHALKQLEQ